MQCDASEERKSKREREREKWKSTKSKSDAKQSGCGEKANEKWLKCEAFRARNKWRRLRNDSKTRSNSENADDSKMLFAFEERALTVRSSAKSAELLQNGGRSKKKGCDAFAEWKGCKNKTKMMSNCGWQKGDVDGRQKKKMKLECDDDTKTDAHCLPADPSREPFAACECKMQSGLMRRKVKLKSPKWAEKKRSTRRRSRSRAD